MAYQTLCPRLLNSFMTLPRPWPTSPALYPSSMHQGDGFDDPLVAIVDKNEMALDRSITFAYSHPVLQQETLDEVGPFLELVGDARGRVGA